MVYIAVMRCGFTFDSQTGYLGCEEVVTGIVQGNLNGCAIGVELIGVVYM